MIRSRQLGIALHPAAGSGALLYTCPASAIAIIRDIRIYNAGGTNATTCYVYLTPSGGTQILALFSDAVIAGVATGRQMDVVLNPGDVLKASSDIADMCYWVSGAELAASP